MPDPKEALYRNTLMLALCDGLLDDREEAFLGELADRLGLEESATAAWRRGLGQGHLDFSPVPDSKTAHQVLTLAVGVIAGNHELDPRERRDLFSLAKALDVDYDLLRTIYERTWGRDAIALALGPVHAIAIDNGLVLTDHFPDLEQFVATARPQRMTGCSLGELRTRRVTAPFCVFHAAASPTETLAVLERLRQAISTDHFIFVVHRREARQIGYLREAGVNNCIVTPAYPGELGDLLTRMGAGKS